MRACCARQGSNCQLQRFVAPHTNLLCWSPALQPAACLGDTQDWQLPDPWSLEVWAECPGDMEGGSYTGPWSALHDHNACSRCAKGLIVRGCASVAGQPSVRVRYTGTDEQLRDEAAMQPLPETVLMPRGAAAAGSLEAADLAAEAVATSHSMACLAERERQSSRSSSSRPDSISTAGPLGGLDGADDELPPASGPAAAGVQADQGADQLLFQLHQQLSFAREAQCTLGECMPGMHHDPARACMHFASAAQALLGMDRCAALAWPRACKWRTLLPPAPHSIRAPELAGPPVCYPCRSAHSGARVSSHSAVLSRLGGTDVCAVCCATHDGRPPARLAAGARGAAPVGALLSSCSLGSRRAAAGQGAADCAAALGAAAGLLGLRGARRCAGAAWRGAAGGVPQGWTAPLVVPQRVCQARGWTGFGCEVPRRSAPLLGSSLQLARSAITPRHALSALLANSLEHLCSCVQTEAMGQLLHALGRAAQGMHEPLSLLAMCTSVLQLQLCQGAAALGQAGPEAGGASQAAQTVGCLGQARQAGEPLTQSAAASQGNGCHLMAAHLRQVRWQSQPSSAGLALWPGHSCVWLPFLPACTFQLGSRHRGPRFMMLSCKPHAALLCRCGGAWHTVCWPVCRPCPAVAALCPAC